jgi:hypothetical protein
VTYFTKSAGDTLTAANVNAMLTQGIPPFADTTARDAAITAPFDGQMAYTTGNDTTWVYRSSAWVILTEPVQSWTPTVTQSNTVTKTVTWGWSQRSGGIFTASCRLDFTGAGTASNIITISGPLTWIVAGGSFLFYDTSLVTYRSGYVQNASTTTFSLIIDEGTGAYGLAGGDGITSGDVLIMTVTGNY